MSATSSGAVGGHRATPRPAHHSSPQASGPRSRAWCSTTFSRSWRGCTWNPHGAAAAWDGQFSATCADGKSPTPSPRWRRRCALPAGEALRSTAASGLGVRAGVRPGQPDPLVHGSSIMLSSTPEAKTRPEGPHSKVGLHASAPGPPPRRTRFCVANHRCRRGSCPTRRADAVGSVQSGAATTISKARS